jgi:hypothetical protein
LTVDILNYAQLRIRALDSKIAMPEKDLHHAAAAARHSAAIRCSTKKFGKFFAPS